MLAHRECLPLDRRSEDLTGPTLEPPQDIGAGLWRALLFKDEAHWPPVHLHQESRKLLVRTASGTWLLKPGGKAALERAGVLQDAGLIPPVEGLRQGLLVSPWLNARPFSNLADHTRRRLLDPLLDQTARYLALLADRFPATDAEGASLTQLLDMAERTTRDTLGADAAEPLQAWRPLLGDLARQVRRVQTDNRMQAWEWLVIPDGRILKADALDHRHDLVGAQDLAWDIAGAAVELDLGEAERDLLLERLARRGQRDYLGQRPLLLAFHEAAYLAYQLGHWTQAAESLADTNPAETQRLQAAANRYRNRLQAGLAAGALTPAFSPAWVQMAMPSAG